MMEQENTEPGTARTLEQLRSDADKSVSEARAAKDAWGEALQRQQRERDAQNGMATYGQMRELVGRHELAELKNGQRAQDAIASALAIASAPENKGRLPGVVTDYLNRQFGFDGKTAGITEGGIDPETGDFGFVFAERDEQGNTSYRKQTIPRSVQLGLMEGYPSLFNEEAVKAHRQKMLDSGLTSAELDAYSNVARLSRERLAKRMEELTPKEKTSGWSPERIDGLGAGRRSIRATPVVAYEDPFRRVRARRRRTGARRRRRNVQQWSNRQKGVVQWSQARADILRDRQRRQAA